ncbi:unnamed protein product [Acanthosepion pharaonis]|uniref:Uncharacterized protein n=1 Tax=Acanthosepion pharaonis TaxID=158019 RepID=A0A812AXD0_ACAPH|nr:unnamed protein product [Sepia pharaonis]
MTAATRDWRDTDILNCMEAISLTCCAPSSDQHPSIPTHISITNSLYSCPLFSFIPFAPSTFIHSFLPFFFSLPQSVYLFPLFIRQHKRQAKSHNDPKVLSSFLPHFHLPSFFFIYSLIIPLSLRIYRFVYFYHILISHFVLFHLHFSFFLTLFFIHSFFFLFLSYFTQCIDYLSLSLSLSLFLPFNFPHVSLSLFLPFNFSSLSLYLFLLIPPPSLSLSLFLPFNFSRVRKCIHFYLFILNNLNFLIMSFTRSYLIFLYFSSFFYSLEFSSAYSHFFHSFLRISSFIRSFPFSLSSFLLLFISFLNTATQKTNKEQQRS